MTVLIGHRGAGKSDFLKWIKMIYPESICIDLDNYIEIKTQKTIQQLFDEFGESEFRKLEREKFDELNAIYQGELHFYLSLGGGFPLDHIPKTVSKWWICRESDYEGRIFIDRPKLNSQLSYLQDDLNRVQKREPLFEAHYDRTFLLPEGMHIIAPNDKEKWIEILKEIIDGSKVPAAITYSVHLIHSTRTYQMVELKSDLHSISDWSSIIKELHENQIAENVLLSFRPSKNRMTRFDLEQIKDLKAQYGSNKVKVDFDVDVFEEFFLKYSRDQIAEGAFGISLIEVDILSSHVEDIDQGILNLERITKDYIQKKNDVDKYVEIQDPHLKLSPIVRNWEELQKGLAWQSHNAQQRSFLPRSETGKWKWVRLYLKDKQKINFIRESRGPYLDQPTLMEWMMTPEGFDNFAGVLGSPVKGSYSPSFHFNFFNQKKIPYWAIEINQNEFDTAFLYLKKLGLKFASITSPLKKCVSKYAGSDEAFNTYREGSEPSFKNTDFLALSIELNLIKDKKVYVWGGGGIQDSLKKIFSNAIYFSARTGRVTYSNQSNVFIPDKIEYLIWAAPRKLGIHFPEQFKQVECVLDLNYSMNSMGREYAARIGAKYISGEEFFRRQARLQQEFWES